MRKSAATTYEQTTTWNSSKTLQIGDKLEGKYLRKEEFDYEDTHYIKYVIETDDGTKYGVYGSATINRQFDNIPVNSYVWIEYEGEGVSKKGRTVKLYKIDYDDEYQA